MYTQGKMHFFVVCTSTNFSKINYVFRVYIRRYIYIIVLVFFISKKVMIFTRNNTFKLYVSLGKF